MVTRRPSPERRPLELKGGKKKLNDNAASDLEAEGRLFDELVEKISSERKKTQRQKASDDT